MLCKCVVKVVWVHVVDTKLWTLFEYMLWECVVKLVWVHVVQVCSSKVFMCLYAVNKCTSIHMLCKCVVKVVWVHVVQVCCKICLSTCCASVSWSCIIACCDTKLWRLCEYTLLKSVVKVVWGDVVAITWRKWYSIQLEHCGLVKCLCACMQLLNVRLYTCCASVSWRLYERILWH
jgi:hypothetical protein